MSNKKSTPTQIADMEPTPPPWVEPRDIRDLFSYRLAFLTRVNDRHAQTVLMDRYQITLGEWRTLATVHYLGSTSLRNLARTTQQDEGLLSRTASSLIKRGLLDKKTNDEDQRVVELTVTAQGLETYDQVMAFAWQLNKELFVDLTEKEQSQLVQLLDKLFRSVSKM